MVGRMAFQHDAHRVTLAVPARSSGRRSETGVHMDRFQDPQATARGGAVEYTTPQLKRLGSATELTKNRLMSGAMDGGANNSRTG